MSSHPFFKSLRGKAAVFVVVISVFGLGVLLELFVRTQRSLTENFRNEKLWMVEHFVMNTLKPMMLSGHANLMSEIMENYKKTPGLMDIGIVRTNGVEAFTDGSTIAEVNGRLGEQRFSRPPVPARKMADTDDAHFKSVMKSGELEVYNGAGNSGVSVVKMLFPIINEPACQGCHGPGHHIRGVLMATFAMTKEDRQILGNMVVLSAIAVAVIVFISAGTLVFFNRAVASRVSRIIRQVNQIVSAGRFEERITVESADELTDLSLAFNRFIASEEGYRRAEELEKDRLEKMVAERTSEIREKNDFIEADLKVARRIQEQLMPLKFPPLDNVEFHAVYLPCMHLGGDYYDVFILPEGHVGVCMVDASGHGSSAALIVAIVKALFFTAGMESPSPGNVVSIINDTLLRITPDESFCTLFYGIINTRTGLMTYSLAGHPPPIVLNTASGKCRMLEVNGHLVGAFDGGPFADSRFQLEPGDRLLAFTDGIIEAVNPEKNAQFGYRRMEKIMVTTGKLRQPELVHRLLAEMNGFSGNALPEDDITLLVVDYKMEGKIGNG